MTVHPIYRVSSFQIVAPYTLRVQFDDQTEQVIDFEPVLAGELYRPLRDLALFNQVRIDPEIQTLVWPVRILIRQRFTTGQNMPRPLRSARGSGTLPTPKRSDGGRPSRHHRTFDPPACDSAVAGSAQDYLS